MHRPFRITGKHARGFTLIELVIIMAIVTILAAIALPTYREAFRRGNRADAKAVVMETAQFMERFFTTNNTYVGAPLLSAVSPKGASGSAVKYAISYTTQTATTYEITAAPANAQIGEACGTLTLTNTGVQTPATPGCW